MEQLGTLTVSIWVFHQYPSGDLGSRRRILQKISGCSRSQAQEITNKFASRIPAEKRGDYEFQFQPDAESLEYSTAHR